MSWRRPETHRAARLGLTMWFLALSLLARLALVAALLPALCGWEEPVAWLAWWTLYFDDRATHTWDEP